MIVFFSFLIACAVEFVEAQNSTTTTVSSPTGSVTFDSGSSWSAAGIVVTIIVVGIVAISILTIIILVARAVASRRKDRLDGVTHSVARDDPYQTELGDLSFSYPEPAVRPPLEKRESIIITETFEGNDLSYDGQGPLMQESEPLPKYERGTFVTRSLEDVRTPASVPVQEVSD